jgi:hypothetical protein
MNLKHTRDAITTLVALVAYQGGTTNAPSGGVRLVRGLDAPTSGVRLVRGLDTPSGKVCLARGFNTPSGEVRLARGLNTPSARSASLEGSAPPWQGRLARGHLHARRPRSYPRVRAFNALTPQDVRHDPDTPGNHVPTLFYQLPGEGHPHHYVALCDEAGVSSVTLCRLPPHG